MKIDFISNGELEKGIEFVNKKWLPHANQQLQKIAA